MPPTRWRYAGYAHRLYAVLHQLDEARPDRILAEAPPQTANWLAVNDRLRRAATLYCPIEIQPKENTHEKAA